MYTSAANGWNEAVEALLQSGDEVNAATEVIVEEWRALIYVNIFQHVGNEMQSVGMASAAAHSIELIV